MKYKLEITFLRTKQDGTDEAYDATEIWRTKQEIYDMFYHPEKYRYNTFFYHMRSHIVNGKLEHWYKCEAYTD